MKLKTCLKKKQKRAIEKISKEKIICLEVAISRKGQHSAQGHRKVKIQKSLNIKKNSYLRTGMSFYKLLKPRIIDREGLSHSKVRIGLKVIGRSKFKKVDPGDQNLH